MLDPASVLKRYFGYETFRPNQRQVVDAVLAGRDVLAVMPTGAGKSVCYQVPALCLAGGSRGPAIVVSPLISLMKDQVGSLNQAGIPAAYLNSSLTGAQQRDVIDRAAAGEFVLLYVAPERLVTPQFIEFGQAHVPTLVAIDEAHCISQWGQDFRPSYTKINQFIDALPKRPTVCAFTATATRQVRDDIRTSLALHNPLQVTASFDRPNLRFEVEAHDGAKWKDRYLLRFCRRHRDQSGIVYCTSRKSVELVCELLQEEGFNAVRYHAGLSAEERRRNQDDFVYDRASVMVATNAFGMGIDKSNVGFVIHYNMPLDLESYYQEAGRAGRDGEPAECVLLYARKDVRTCEFLLENGFTESAEIDGPTRAELLDRARKRLKAMTYYCTTSDCLRAYILRYFDEQAPGYCGNCSNCDTNFEEQDVTVEVQKVLSCVFRLQQRGRYVGKSTIVEILRGSRSEKMQMRGYDTLSTYGIMADASTRRIRFLIDELEQRGLLQVQPGDYPVVMPTVQAGEFLHERRTMTLRMPKPDAIERASERIARGGEGPVGTPTNPHVRETALDPELFQKLKELRAQIAAREGVPAYVVFSNHTLHDMCRQMPRDVRDLLDVSGVGEVKADRYGAEFLAVIDAYRTDEAAGEDDDSGDIETDGDGGDAEADGDDARIRR